MALLAIQASLRLLGCSLSEGLICCEGECELGCDIDAAGGACAQRREPCKQMFDQFHVRKNEPEENCPLGMPALATHLPVRGKIRYASNLDRSRSAPPPFAPSEP